MDFAHLLLLQLTWLEAQVRVQSPFLGKLSPCLFYAWTVYDCSVVIVVENQIWKVFMPRS